jgi:glucose-1-phosphate thymidylyltransferase
LIITTPEDLKNYKLLLGDGSKLGIIFQYAVQEKPKGIADAITVGKNFIGNDNVCLILGDNIFHGQGLFESLKKAISVQKGATIFAYKVMDPKRFGIVEFNNNLKAISIEEKPKNPKSNYAVTGLYFYDNTVVNIVNSLKPSNRGELEITDVNECYLTKKKLNVEIFGRGFAWLDTGTQDSLVDASQYIQAIENRQGFKVACLEEISWRNKWISTKQLVKIGKKINNTIYGKYLLEIAKEK